MLRVCLVIIIVMLLATTTVHAQEPTAEPATPEPGTDTTIEVETVVTPVGTEESPQSSSEPAPIVAVESVAEHTTRLTFQEMGFDAEFLRGIAPFSRMTYQFGLPANWILTPESEVVIHLTGSEPTSEAENVSHLAAVEIAFNGVWVDTFVINWTTASTLTFSIPENAVAPTRDDGRHELTIAYDPVRGCDGAAGGVMVDNTSLLQLQYTEIEPSTDLRLLPRPFFQRSFMPERVQVVLPTDPTEVELEAAMRLVASLGHSTFGGLQIDLITTEALTSDLLADTNLIFVGKTPAFADLEIDAPEQAASAGDEQGVIWMAVSPWNPANVVMMVSGNTDEAVRKAGLAISHFQIRPAGSPDIAIVTDSSLDAGANPASAVVTTTLKDQGYEIQTLDRVGVNEFQIAFTVPAGTTLGPDAYFDLDFNHSRLLAYDESGVTISLNDVPIGSIPLSDENANLTTQRFPLPTSLIQPGQNYLTIQAELRPASECYNRDTQATWFIIHDSSVLNLPPAEASAPVSVGRSVDLRYYPQPFSNSPTLNSTLLLLPRDNPTAWDSAANLIFNLGDEANGSRYEVAVAFADSVTPELLANKNLILVGTPGELPQVAAWNDHLPAYFPAESNIAVERGAFEVYEQSPDRSVAYVELLPSPVSPEYQAMLVLGNDNTALQNISLLLSDSRLRSDMLGNLVILDEGQVLARNVSMVSSEPSETTAVGPLDTAETGSQDTMLAVSEESKTQADRNDWIPDFIRISSVFMVSVVGVALVMGMIRTRRRRL